MAVEAKRGCGFRKVGGTYLISGKPGFACDRLPFELNVCPCCGGGIKQARGWTWISPEKLFGDHANCNELGRMGTITPMAFPVCPMCQPHFIFKPADPDTPEIKAALLWVGEKFYTPEEFMEEARTMGISKRIPTIPKGVDLTSMWVFLAHPNGLSVWDFSKEDENGQLGVLEERPAIITAFKPTHIERIVNQSDMDKVNAGAEDAETQKLRELTKKGVKLVAVPDDDPDHH